MSDSMPKGPVYSLVVIVILMVLAIGFLVGLLIAKFI